ncbi:TadE/TadG family type IV pilus assembly protein [Alkalihalobacillus pseudalcaliphilus]|uniref:TadE/TadG family type IV pilus assembly protein n=1 Tax=Alkalihalobacillus pseudalcaliphilus TaxID=79884 RepID=UPI00064DB530|nr:TadE family protein [Alkalihalobacillus pseudalcaliphilus]KMK78251.1 hypothetical protein AB990_02100 [Alkalihalobacillus pseudalcaliphilus]
MFTKFRRSEDGSLTLEAAMVLPVFLLFTVFLAMMIRISVADMALKQAVSETTQIVATHAYPFALLAEGGTNAADKWIKNTTEDEVSLDKISELVGEIFEAFDIDIHGILSGVASTAANPFVKNNFERANSDGRFEKDGVTVTDVDVSNLSFPEFKGYIGITATYEVPIVAPFVNRTITLEQSAYEKVWTGS